MSTLSRTAEKCRKCSNVKNCNNKRLEACALAELPKQSSINVTAPLADLSTIQISRPVTPITIHMGEFGDIQTTMEEINEKINDRIAKALSVNSCYFK